MRRRRFQEIASDQIKHRTKMRKKGEHIFLDVVCVYVNGIQYLKRCNCIVNECRIRFGNTDFGFEMHFTSGANNTLSDIPIASPPRMHQNQNKHTHTHIIQNSLYLSHVRLRLLPNRSHNQYMPWHVCVSSHHRCTVCMEIA